MARIFIGGREIEVPEDAEGYVNVEQLHEAAGVPRDRAIIRQTPSGENTVIPRGRRLRVNPYDRFIDAPRARRV